MIVESVNHRVARMYGRRVKIRSIAQRLNLTSTSVRERLSRMGLWRKRTLKSEAQRKALARIRRAAGDRTLGSAYDPGTTCERKRPERRKPRLLMIVWRGFKRNTEVEVSVRDCGAGAGQIACIECGGDGDWGKFVPYVGLTGNDAKCVECKGTGKVFVSI